MSVYKAIHGVMSDLSKVGISKEKTNSQQGFKYRGVDDVMNVVSSLLSKHGLLILPRVMKRECIERQTLTLAQGGQRCAHARWGHFARIGCLGHRRAR